MIAPPIKIIAFNEEEELARYSLEPGEYTVGRSAACNLQLKVQGVSREHARLIVGEDGALALEDRGSANGTFVDQWRVRGRVNVRPNQTIKLGAVTLFLQESSAGSECGSPVSIAAGNETDLPAEFHRADRYDVGEELAKGGMGAILIARQATIRRTVAMKVMLGKAARSPRHRLRFIEEAQITGQLEHPNIVPVHELGVDADGQVFYTMKLVKGITLKKILQLLRKGVPETVAKYQLPALLTVFQKVCDALAFAHTKGVIHRDLKPANIMVGYFGEVLVMDWGLAKVVEGRELKIERPDAGSAEPLRPNFEHVSSARHDEGDVFATMDGAVIGTPHYMSPEQAGGDIDSLDARSDIFALGAILYELLTFELPFPGATVPEVLEKIKNGDVIPPHKIGKEVPESLSAVCMKALAHDPSQRYPRVKEFQADLTAYQAGFATGAETKSAWKQVKLFVRRHKSASIFGAAIVTLIVCFSIKLLADRGRIIDERNRAEKALGELKKTAPSLQQLADSEAALQRFDSALQKLDAALALDGSHLPSYWRRAWLLIGMERFPEAQQALLLAQKKDPRNTRNARILPIIVGMASAANDPERYKAENSGELISYLQEVGASGEMLALSKKLQISAQRKAQIIKSRLKEWLGGERITEWLKVDVDGVVSVTLPAVPDLEPLRGLPIDKLTIDGGKKGPSTLEPLRGLRLIEISLRNTNISDLSPLKGMPLRLISLGGSKVTDLSPLRGAPLDAVYCAATNLIDMSPLRRAPLKRVLAGNNAIADLTFLVDAPIEELDISGNRIADLSRLRGKRLRKLIADGNSITDLKPLRGAPIEELSVAHQSHPLTDLSPLLDLAKLVKLRISDGSAKALGALRKHPTLKYISVINHDNAPYTPADEFWKEYDAKNKP